MSLWILLTLTASAEPWFEDVTAAWIGSVSGPSHGLAAADVDGDGDVDLWATNHHRPSTLWLNDGTGRLTDATALRVPEMAVRDVHGAAWGDVDGDGDLDLLEVAGARHGTGAIANRLWLQEDGLFVDRAEAAGLAIPRASGRTVAWADVDFDGDLDAVLSQQEQEDGDGAPVGVWRQEAGTFAGPWDPFAADPAKLAGGLQPVRLGPEPGVHLLRWGRPRGVDLVRLGPGAAPTPVPLDGVVPHLPVEATWGDVDGDGRLDLLLTRRPGKLHERTDVLGRAFHDRLYLQRGAPGAIRWEDATAAWGLEQPTEAYASALADLDGDGDLDLFHACGHPGADLPDRLFENVGGRFVEVSGHGAEGDLTGRADVFVLADLDGDGRLDLVAAHGEGEGRGPLQVFRGLRGPGRTVVVDPSRLGDAGTVTAGWFEGVAGGARRVAPVPPVRRAAQDDPTVRFALPEDADGKGLTLGLTVVSPTGRRWSFEGLTPGRWWLTPDGAVAVPQAAASE